MGGLYVPELTMRSRMKQAQVVLFSMANETDSRWFGVESSGYGAIRELFNACIILVAIPFDH